MRLRRLALLSIAAGLACAPARAEIKVGEKFPALGSAEATLLAGDKLPDLGGKVVLVDFWASWCGPCKASFPAMAKLHADYAARGLVVVAVSVDDQRAAAEGFWKRMSAPFTGVHDTAKALVRAAGAPAMPTSYLLGRDGRVRSIHAGYHGAATDRTLRKEIEALLAESIPTS